MTDQSINTRRLFSLGDLTNASFDVTIFALTAAGTYLAQYMDRPITAVLIFLMGVIAIGARSGVYSGVFAAVAASFVYNFFLSEPVFMFGISTADEIVPLVAFNVSAVVAGALAGRLADTAKLAKVAEKRSRFLLQVSGELQQAIDGNDVAEITRRLLPLERLVDLEIYIYRDGALCRSGTEAIFPDPLTALLAEKTSAGSPLSFQAFVLNASNGEHGIVKFFLAPRQESDGDLPDLQALANLLALAVDRCLLLEKAAEATAMKRSEELKTAILASVSHDLRTPLTAIEAAATGLRSFRHDLSDSQKDSMLDTINEQCRRLNRYTANLLDMGRIQSGIPDANLCEVDVIEIVGVVLNSTRQLFPDCAIAKDFRLGAAIVWANATMLEQVIFNILENAFVHGSSSEPVVVRIDASEDGMILEISDCGPGISQVDRPHIFERFYRAGDRIHRRGSGLGLYIAKGFVEAFRGKISARSVTKDGKGTKIVIELPLIEPAIEHEQETA
ncbi:sensor histidine kinase [Croceicoccus mobilis]|uniref:histidine kinase n=1 Tax=Croceicoccus mobilis TaxID=1703339 RepID=A0A916ZAP6_9SPHN|nr:ATP-binding protein [Croceicoccus mobilis]GGD82865.1 hypothetical protein GCM10010990_36140 [Croceicoccus mobilis]